MDASTLLTLRDPAGIPFYPVVFQALYILTWMLHATFVFLTLGAMSLSIYGTFRQKNDSNWKIMTPHLIQAGKISVSLLIVLGVAPLLFEQVIYDPNWYTANALSGVWIFVFIYTLLVGYTMYYWYYYANKKKEGGGKIIGMISLAIFIFAGILMHNFAITAIMPNDWMKMYAPNGVVNNSGLNFNVNLIRLVFLLSLSMPTVGILLQSYSRFLSTRDDFSQNFISYTASLGTKIALCGLAISSIFFIAWMLKIGYLTHLIILLTILTILILFFMVYKNSNSYITTAMLLVFLLFISGIRELIRFDIMSNLGYNIYNYHINFEIPSTVMFVLTFLIMGVVGVAYLLTMAWKVGKSKNKVFDGSKDIAVSKLGTYTIYIMVLFIVVYFAWGIITLFSDAL